MMKKKTYLIFAVIFVLVVALVIVMVFHNQKNDANLIPTPSEAQSASEPTAVPGENYVFIANVIEIEGAYYHFRDLGRTAF